MNFKLREQSSYMLSVVHTRPRLFSFIKNNLKISITFRYWQKGIG